MTTNGAETDALRAQPERMLLLAAVPCALEVATIAGAAPFVFPSLGFDARWGLALGFVLADVSPAVCVPLLLDLQVVGGVGGSPGGGSGGGPGRVYRHATNNSHRVPRGEGGFNEHIGCTAESEPLTPTTPTVVECECVATASADLQHEGVGAASPTPDDNPLSNSDSVPPVSL